MYIHTYMYMYENLYTCIMSYEQKNIFDYMYQYTYIYICIYTYVSMYLYYIYVYI